MTLSSTKASRPVSRGHATGLRWFASLTRTANRRTTLESLQQSMEFYNRYAQTGDYRYLDLCEDLLRVSLIESHV